MPCVYGIIIGVGCLTIYRNDLIRRQLSAFVSVASVVEIILIASCGTTGISDIEKIILAFMLTVVPN